MSGKPLYGRKRMCSPQIEARLKDAILALQAEDAILSGHRKTGQWDGPGRW